MDSDARPRGGGGGAIQRRDLIIGAAASGWAAAAHAEPEAPTKRAGVLVGVLHDYEAADPEGKAQLDVFRGELERLGWRDGGNLRLLYRSGAADVERLRVAARELMTLRPDVALGAGGTIVAALQRADPTVPVVFVNVTDPIGGGLVTSLARPGHNTTGFTQFEFGISAKWLELLKEAAPEIRRVAVIRDPTARSGGGQLGAIEAAAAALHVEVQPIDPREADEIERGLAELAHDGKTGLIVTTSRLARRHRDLILAAAAAYRMPAIYPFRVFAAAGGLIYYGPDSTEPYRRAAGYVGRILKGEKAGEMPVQAATRYELVVNLKTANALGLTLPPSLTSRADEVIE